ncbi:MAG: serine/threonine-protein kinase [Verrucomicrobiales bacterium]
MSEPGKESLTNDCPACGTIVEVSRYMPFEEVACPSCGELMRVRVVFDHYHIEEMRGVGGMSQVFIALDAHLNRLVALKVLNRENSSKEDRIVQFEREARLTASISHPNVVRVYGVGHAQGNFYIAMELVEGASLEEMLRQQEKLTEPQVLDLAIQTAEGLAAAYRVGLIHRDIKPGNILLTSEGKAKLVDFGLALVFEKDVDTSDEIWATPYYVPPEKLAGLPEDFRGDIYSLGSTFFHLLAGCPPYDTQSASIDELKEIKSRPVRLGAFAPMISGPTQQIVNRMMELKPESRYQSYDELLEALRQAREKLLGSLGLIKQATRQSRREEQRRKKIIQASTAAVLLAVATIGLVVWHAVGGEDPAGGAAASGGEVVGGDGFGVATVESDNVGERFVKARQQLIAGNLADARQEFVSIFDLPRTRQPTLNWAAYNAALASLLTGEPGEARLMIGRMKNHPDFQQGRVGNAGPFFRRVTEFMLESWPVPLSELEEMKKTQGWEAAALLAGLKSWEHGRFNDAAVFLQTVRDAKPARDLSWITELNPILVKYTTDAALIAGLSPIHDLPRSTNAESALKETRDAIGQLRTDGRAKRFLEARASGLEKQRDTLLAAEKKADDLAQQERATREMAELDALAVKLASFRDGYRFEEAVNELRAFTPQTTVAKDSQAIMLWKWQGGVDFFTTLVADLNTKPYRGNLQIREGAAALSDISVTKATRATLVLSGRVGVLNASIAQMPASQIVTLAVSMLEKTTVEADVNLRRSLLARFCLLIGQMDAANRWAASLEKDGEFTARWKAALALLSPAPATTP